MANKEYLALLRQSVEAWNHWREKNPLIFLKGKGLDLSGVDLSRANLSGANLSWTNLRGTDLRGANLSGSILDKADLRQTYIDRETIIDDKWRQVWEIVNQVAVEKKLSGADLRGANMTQANLSGVDLRGANLSRADLSRADLSGVNLTRADLSWTNLRGTNLSKANLSGAILDKADLRQAQINQETIIDDKWHQVWKIVNQVAIVRNLSGVDLSGANLRNANLSQANLSQIDLRKANLTEANLSGANLREANLTETNLSGADLSGANLSKANLSGAILDKANLKQVRISQETVIDDKWLQIWKIVNQVTTGKTLTRADLSGANLSGANIGWTNLREANFTGTDLKKIRLFEVDLRDANLSAVDLRGANLIKTDLRKANLRGAKLMGINFSRANLSEQDLSKQDLREANFSEANLSRVNFSRANLSQANLSQANLREANLREANLNQVNLAGANLREAILTGQDLSDRDFRGHDLSRANLMEANLSRIQALGTNFKGAKFTGACLEDWKIDNATNFDNVICDYIYLKADRQERRPQDPNKNFTPGEFKKFFHKFFQKVLETIDIIFTDGIDWRAFVLSFQELQFKYQDKHLSIQAVENKPDGFFVIRLNVSSDADKVLIETQAKKLYQFKLKALEDRYRVELKAKDEQIAIYRQQSVDLLELAKLAATQPLTFDPKALAQSTSQRNIYQLQLKTLAETAAEIQQLLEQLSQTYPSKTTAQKMVVITDVVEQIESNPTLKAEIINALKTVGAEELKAAINHPLVNILMIVIQEWEEAN
ncbi:MAG: pentapeptide repeat-containing protein [Prochloraceae cyanobacterium]